MRSLLTKFAPVPVVSLLCFLWTPFLECTVLSHRQDISYEHPIHGRVANLLCTSDRDDWGSHCRELTCALTVNEL